MPRTYKEIIELAEKLGITEFLSEEIFQEANIQTMSGDEWNKKIYRREVITDKIVELAKDLIEHQWDIYREVQNRLEAKRNQLMEANFEKDLKSVPFTPNYSKFAYNDEILKEDKYSEETL